MHIVSITTMTLREAEPSLAECLLVRLESDTGLVGWGESQGHRDATQRIVTSRLAPALLRYDPRAWGPMRHELRRAAAPNGAPSSGASNAVAAVDSAVRDLAARALGVGLASTLGGRYRESLPWYVTGLEGESGADRAEQASRWVEQGARAIELGLGRGVALDLAEAEGIRDAVRPETRLFADAARGYDRSSATRLGRGLEQLGVERLGSPLASEDRTAHALLAADVDIAIAVGRGFAGAREFIPWFRDHAVDVGLADVTLMGVSEIAGLIDLAQAFNVPIDLTPAQSTVVGTAASWHLAATLPDFHAHGVDPGALSRTNGWLHQPLEVSGGHLAVPDGPGLGIDIDEQRLARDVATEVTVHA